MFVWEVSFYLCSKSTNNLLGGGGGMARIEQRQEGRETGAAIEVQHCQFSGAAAVMEKEARPRCWSEMCRIC